MKYNNDNTSTIKIPKNGNTDDNQNDHNKYEDDMLCSGMILKKIVTVARNL
jgi:hypothetical protein